MPSSLLLYQHLGGFVQRQLQGGIIRAGSPQHTAAFARLQIVDAGAATAQMLGIDRERVGLDAPVGDAVKIQMEIADTPAIEAQRDGLGGEGGKGAVLHCQAIVHVEGKRVATEALANHVQALDRGGNALDTGRQAEGHRQGAELGPTTIVTQPIGKILAGEKESEAERIAGDLRRQVVGQDGGQGQRRHGVGCGLHREGHSPKGDSEGRGVVGATVRGGRKCRELHEAAGGQGSCDEVALQFDKRIFPRRTKGGYVEDGAANCNQPGHQHSEKDIRCSFHKWLFI